MKKIFLGAIAVLAINVAVAQNIHRSEVPSVISNKFNTQFPKVKDVEWEKGNNFYKVEFETVRGLDHDVWYDKSGEVVKHKEEIFSKDLPQVIKTSLKANYKNYLIDDVDKITEGDSITYKVEIEKLSEEITIFYKEDGTIIKIK